MNLFKRALIKGCKNINKSNLAISPETAGDIKPQDFDELYKLDGIKSIPSTKVGFIFNNILIRNKYPEDFILSHLKKIYNGVMRSIEAGDKEFLDNYCEKRLANGIISHLNILKEKGLYYKYENDLEGVNMPGETFKMVDCMVVQGLSLDRESNGKVDEYNVFKDKEEMGLTVFSKKIMGNELNFIEKVQGDAIYSDYVRMIARVLVLIKSPIILNLYNENGTKYHHDLDNNNHQTWTHLAMFECELKEPETFKSKYKMENYMEWITKFKLGKWILSDLDHCLNGNSFFVEKYDNIGYKDPIFKGSKYEEYGKNISDTL